MFNKDDYAKLMLLIFPGNLMHRLFFILLFLVISNSYSESFTCPNPQTSSLRFGIIPEPWLLNPYSPNKPQADENIQFRRANILVAGIGRGVVCTYQNQNQPGNFSIWWPVLVKIPYHSEYWIETLGGFVCSEPIELCNFRVSLESMILQ